MKSAEKLFLIDGFLSIISKYSLEEQKKIIFELKNKFYNKSFYINLKIPANIFSKKLGTFETICKYLKENLELNFKEISKLTDRSISNVENSYKKARLKFKQKIKTEQTYYYFPLTILKNKKFGIQESIVGFLHDEYSLQFNQIASLLKRNYQTIRTAYLKFKEKGEKE